MMALLLPTVAKQRVQIEAAMMNSVMKVLTPSQVASYKINMSMPPLY
jgi:competence protein ComGC